MNVSNLIEVLTILVPEDRRKREHVHAEHDVLYLPGGQDVSDATFDALDALGAFWDEGVECWAVFT